MLYCVWGCSIWPNIFLGKFRSNQKDPLITYITNLIQAQASAVYRVKMYLLLLCYYEYFNKNLACQFVADLLQVNEYKQ